MTEGSQAKPESEPTVWVRRQWNEWRHARYRLVDVEHLHWSTISGGVQARAPRPFVHGYVLCDQMLEGELGHACRHGPPPHRIKVCITKKGNEAVFAAVLERMADDPEAPSRRSPPG